MKTDRLPFWVLDMLVAGSLLSRLPLPQLHQDAYERSARAVWAYSVTGAVLGLIAGGVGFALMGLGLPAGLAAGVALAVLMLSTGGMHEDGLADTADGFWGGFDPTRRLAIMKDSHLGTYGLLALIMVTGLRWIGYTFLLPLGVLPVVAVAVLSRGVMPCLMVALPHARDTGLSHSVGRPGEVSVITGLGLALVLSGVSLGGIAILCLLVALLTAAAMGLLARAKIGGQTGDVLGAVQQLSEVAVLMVLVAVLT